MPTMIKFLAAGAFAFAASTLCAVPATAADVKPAKSTRVKAAKKAKQVKQTKEVHPKAVDVMDHNDPEYPEPDVTNTATTDYDCELGNKVTIYQNQGDESHIALRWKKRLHRLTRVGTTTGAKRFENRLFGLTWIGIPAKGMLLDSKLNRQLANECKSPEQVKPPVLEVPQPQESGQPAPTAVPTAMPSPAPSSPAASNSQPAVPGQPAA